MTSKNYKIEFQKYFGIKDASGEFINKFKLLENLYKKGKITLDELSIITEISRENLQKYFEKKREEISAKKTILVCGGAGFIGSNFVRYIYNKYKNYKIINYDKLTYAGNPANLKDIKEKESAKKPSERRYYFIRGDICNKNKLEEVVKKFKPDYIINFAAESHVGRSIYKGAYEFVKTNVLGVLNLLEITKNFNISRFVHISTDEVYGELDINDFKSFTEDSPFKPNVPYSASKAGGDLMARAYYQTFKVPVIVTHCTNNYGAYQYPEKVIPFWTLKAKNKEKLPIHGDGKHIRDWIYVEEHCYALDLVLHKGIPGEVYNIAARQEYPIIEIAIKILKILGRPKTLIKFIKDRPGNDRRYSLDITKIKRELGFEPKIKLEKKLPEVVEWYLKNDWWLETVFKRAKKFSAYI